MSALNHTAPRFRSHAPAPLPGAVSGLPYPSTLDVPPRLATSLGTPLPTPLATPLAPPPPPPLHLSSSQPNPRSAVRYAGPDHTLGPAFSEEEDGDDSDFIAAKMASLGLDPRGANAYSSYHTQQQQQQQQQQAAELQRRMQAQVELQLLQQQQQRAQQAQQTASLQNLLLQSNDPQQLREAMALLELQRAQIAATTPSTHLERAYAQQRAALAVQSAQSAQSSYQRALQQQTLYQAQYAAHGQRQALAAQLEAGALRREREREQRSRPLSRDDAHLRAAWENAPLGYFPPISPVDSAAGVGWTSSTKPAAAERADRPLWSAPAATHPPHRTLSMSSTASAPSPTTPTQNPYAQSQPLGRFARARQDLLAAQQAGQSTAVPLATLLSRRRPADDDSLSSSSFPETVATSPISETAPVRNERKWSTESSLGGRKVVSESGHTILTRDPMAYIPPAPRSASFSVSDTPRATPTTPPTASYVVRQPLGPPGSADELKLKNFASRLATFSVNIANSSIRRKAGQNLGMLNRRTGTDTSE